MRYKTISTLAALVVILIFGAYTGTKLLIASPNVVKADTATCKDRTLAQGDKLTPNLVPVNVYNSGSTAGLANRVRINLQRKGFLPGVIGNSPGGVVAKAVTILTVDPKAPDAVLVAAQFNGVVEFAAPPAGVAEGVNVVLGNAYAGLKKDAPRAVAVTAPLSICEPIDQDAIVIK
ncbi:hypothetical protein BH09ACT10_BH09ACT10_26680 [soil metagenome]